MKESSEVKRQRRVEQGKGNVTVDNASQISKQLRGDSKSPEKERVSSDRSDQSSSKWYERSLSTLRKRGFLSRSGGKDTDISESDEESPDRATRSPDSRSRIQPPFLSRRLTDDPGLTSASTGISSDESDFSPLPLEPTYGRHGANPYLVQVDHAETDSLFTPDYPYEPMSKGGPFSSPFDGGGFGLPNSDRGRGEQQFGGGDRAPWDIPVDRRKADVISLSDTSSMLPHDDATPVSKKPHPSSSVVMSQRHALQLSRSQHEGSIERLELQKTGLDDDIAGFKQDITFWGRRQQDVLEEIKGLEDSERDKIAELTEKRALEKAGSKTGHAVEEEGGESSKKSAKREGAVAEDSTEDVYDKNDEQLKQIQERKKSTKKALISAQGEFIRADKGLRRADDELKSVNAEIQSRREDIDRIHDNQKKLDAFEALDSTGPEAPKTVDTGAKKEEPLFSADDPHSYEKLKQKSRATGRSLKSATKAADGAEKEAKSARAKADKGWKQAERSLDEYNLAHRSLIALRLNRSSLDEDGYSADGEVDGKSATSESEQERLEKRISDAEEKVRDLGPKKDNAVNAAIKSEKAARDLDKKAQDLRAKATALEDESKKINDTLGKIDAEVKEAEVPWKDLTTGEKFKHVFSKASGAYNWYLNNVVWGVWGLPNQFFGQIADKVGQGTDAFMNMLSEVAGAQGGFGAGGGGGGNGMMPPMMNDSQGLKKQEQQAHRKRIMERMAKEGERPEPIGPDDPREREIPRNLEDVMKLHGKRFEEIHKKIQNNEDLTSQDMADLHRVLTLSGMRVPIDKIVGEQFQRNVPEGVRNTKKRVPIEDRHMLEVLRAGDEAKFEDFYPTEGLSEEEVQHAERALANMRADIKKLNLDVNDAKSLLPLSTIINERLAEFYQDAETSHVMGEDRRAFVDRVPAGANKEKRRSLTINDVKEALGHEDQLEGTDYWRDHHEGLSPLEQEGARETIRQIAKTLQDEGFDINNPEHLDQINKQIQYHISAFHEFAEYSHSIERWSNLRRNSGLTGDEIVEWQDLNEELIGRKNPSDEQYALFEAFVMNQRNYMGRLDDAREDQALEENKVWAEEADKRMYRYTTPEDILGNIKYEQSDSSTLSMEKRRWLRALNEDEAKIALDISSEISKTRTPILRKTLSDPEVILAKLDLERSKQRMGRVEKDIRDKKGRREDVGDLEDRLRILTEDYNNLHNEWDRVYEERKSVIEASAASTPTDSMTSPVSV